MGFFLKRKNVFHHALRGRRKDIAVTDDGGGSIGRLGRPTHLLVGRTRPIALSLCLDAKWTTATSPINSERLARGIKEQKTLCLIGLGVKKRKVGVDANCKS